MAKTSRSTAVEPSRREYVEQLTSAVSNLADELRVVRDVLDDVREDLSWLTRNGIPGNREGHAEHLRMARDPLALDATEHFEMRYYEVETNSAAEFPSDKFDELLADITESVTVLGQEQMNLMLSALDDMRNKLLAAIKTPPPDPKPRSANSAREHPLPSEPAKPSGPAKHLF